MRAVILITFIALGSGWPAAHLVAQNNKAAGNSGAKIWDGVYSEDQAERARKPFTAVCRRCHNDDMGGSDRGPSLHGERFMANWETQGVNLLFAKIRDTMPPDSPSSLPEQDYLDLVTLILRANGFPAGSGALSMDGMNGVLIVKKPGDGPQEVANFRLVEVVGCLSRGSDDAWTLTKTTDPVVTNDQQPTPERLQEAAARPPGSQTFRLVSVSSFKPERYQGQRVQVKGLIYRAPNRDRINLTSLEMVSPSCGS